jgi:hypothetical protein
MYMTVKTDSRGGYAVFDSRKCSRCLLPSGLRVIPPPVKCLTEFLFLLFDFPHAAFTKVVPNQANTCQEAASEPAAAAVDPDENGEHHPVERQATSLAPNQAGIVTARIAVMSLATPEKNLL